MRVVRALALFVAAARLGRREGVPVVLVLRADRTTLVLILHADTKVSVADYLNLHPPKNYKISVSLG